MSTTTLTPPIYEEKRIFPEVSAEEKLRGAILETQSEVSLLNKAFKGLEVKPKFLLNENMRPKIEADFNVHGLAVVAQLTAETAGSLYDIEKNFGISEEQLRDLFFVPMAIIVLLDELVESRGIASFEKARQKVKEISEMEDEGPAKQKHYLDGVLPTLAKSSEDAKEIIQEFVTLWGKDHVKLDWNGSFGQVVNEVLASMLWEEAAKDLVKSGPIDKKLYIEQVSISNGARLILPVLSTALGEGDIYNGHREILLAMDTIVRCATDSSSLKLILDRVRRKGNINAYLDERERGSYVADLQEKVNLYFNGRKTQLSMDIMKLAFNNMLLLLDHQSPIIRKIGGEKLRRLVMNLLS